MIPSYYATPRRNPSLIHEHRSSAKWNSRWLNQYKVDKHKKTTTFVNDNFPQQSLSLMRQIINNLAISQTPASVRLMMNRSMSNSSLKGFLRLISNDQVEITTINGTQIYPLNAIQSIQ